MPVSRFSTRSRILIAGLCLAAGATVSSCSSTQSPAAGELTDRYTYAQTLVGKEDYDKAIIELEALMFDARATSLEDDVLFDLAEAYYESEQYLLAAEIYRRLLEQTPGSTYAADAQFKLAKSYEELSFDFARDQEYTKKAIREFQLFLDMYPVRDPQQLTTDVEMYRELVRLNPDNVVYQRQLALANAEYGRVEKAQESVSSIIALREKLAHSSFSIAEQYRSLKRYRASIMYYDEVLRYYPDTIYFEKAWVGKIEVLIKREKWYEAKAVLDGYEQQFPQNLDRVSGYREKVIEHFSNQ